MSELRTPSKNPSSPLHGYGPQSASVSGLPQPPSLQLNSPQSQNVHETSTTQQGGLLTVDAVRAMQLFTGHFETKVEAIYDAVQDQELLFRFDVSALEDLELQTLVVSAPDTLQVIGDAALRAVAQDYVQR